MYSFFNIKNDNLLLIPISTRGNISNENKIVLNDLDFPLEYFANKRQTLGDVNFFYLNDHDIYLAFICINNRFNTLHTSVFNLIGRKIANQVNKLNKLNKITIVFDSEEYNNVKIKNQSFDILIYTLFEHIENKNIEIGFINFLEKDYYFRKNNRYINSTLLVIETELKNIITDDSVQKIISEEKFYYTLAEEQYNQYINFENSSTFFIDILEKSIEKKHKLSELLNSYHLQDKQYSFLVICGQFISYLIKKSYNYDKWNLYEDKRTIFQHNVKSETLLSELINFKITPYEKNYPNLLKIIYFFQRPDFYFYFSEDVQNRITNNFTNYLESTFTDTFEEIIINFFTKIGVKAINPVNNTILFNHILHLSFIKPLWQNVSSTSNQLTIINNFSLANKLINQCLDQQNKFLDIGNCGITSLDFLPKLFECIHLETLILSNEWAEFIDNKWRRMKSLNNERKNSLNSIPKNINKLQNLKILICGGDWNINNDKQWNRWSINSLNSITNLKKLEYLNLSNNKIKSLRGLNNISTLKSIHLNNNEINIVEPLYQLTRLQELYLSNNKIKNIDFLAKLKNIKTIDIHKNLIKDLRPIKDLIKIIDIENSKWEVNVINVAKNPLEVPPMEIVNSGSSGVIGFFNDIENNGYYINKELKVILVGNSEVGKSTLLKYLDAEKGLNDPHHSTIWLEEKIIQSKYKVDSLKGECLLHVFDFGGHDYYHDTHHLFYSTNTVYLLLWDANTNNLNTRISRQLTKNNTEIEIETQDYPIKYWLDSIKFYTKDVKADNFEFEIEDTYNSPLLLIQNKVSDTSSIIFLNNQDIKNNYSFVHEIINFSLKPKRNLDHFDNLISEIINKMTIIGAKLPKYYGKVIELISNHKGTQTFSEEEFLIFCNNNLKDKLDLSQIDTLTDYLEQTGKILCIKKEKHKRIYIDKNWIIQNIYKILENMSKYKGEFNKKQASEFIDNKNNIEDVLQMMIEFKIIFFNKQTNNYIAPLYLPKIPDKKVEIFLNSSQPIFRRFEFNGFIHKNLILTIFQQYGNQSSLDEEKHYYYYWKDGLIIKNPLNSEIVMIVFNIGNEQGNAYIDVINLSDSTKESFVNEVANYIREISEKYELDEMVTLDNENFISKKLLETNAEIGKHVFSEKKSTDYNNKIEKKLFKLKDYMHFIDTPIKKKNVVISYSKKDLGHIHTLRRYLQPLVDEDLIEQPWYCTNLKAGDDWNTTIKNRFEEADIIFFMVSEYFYTTRYIVDYEIKCAIDRYDNGENIKIVPIILDFYRWGRKDPYNLQRFNALPYQAKPISDFKNPNIAWNTITDSIKTMIEKDLDPTNSDIISREFEEIYERQVKGKLDNNA